MRNAKKYKEKLFKAGYTLQAGGVYWLNGDAKLTASERQKFRKFLSWLEKLPERFRSNFGLDMNIEILSNFYIWENGQRFCITGVNAKDRTQLFDTDTLVNFVWDEDDEYIDHWEGFKGWLREFDTNNLDGYLVDYFRPINVFVNDYGDIEISHLSSIYGIKNVVDVLHDELKKEKRKGWEFLEYARNPKKLLGSIKNSDKEVFFWEGGYTYLKSLEVEYSKDGNIIDYVWGETSYKVVEEEDGKWLYVWDNQEHNHLKYRRYEF